MQMEYILIFIQVTLQFTAKNIIIFRTYFRYSQKITLVTLNLTFLGVGYIHTIGKNVPPVDLYVIKNVHFQTAASYPTSTV